MDELFPILGGVALGLAFYGRLKAPLAYFGFVLLGISIAVLASAISGELVASWWYVAIDLIETFAAALLTIAAVPSLRRAWAIHSR